MKTLNFVSKNKESVQNETSEVIHVNFWTKEITKSVETNNETGQVVSLFETGDVLPTVPPFMGEGFSGVIDLLLKKKAKNA